ncbi:hypothetical protein D9619_003149 [Psilocybe cf. subviscida]|uniref:DUF1764-domain-containing protein n=1 Tax=Psilocybe cf. subviscida TaxID=2480587 RepID=A0A8H5AX13_9AGAR|nr:hypothetical protein D9619_003149 [Psilocybe cf. subviscida]
MSEIDDIFSGKAKAKSKGPASSIPATVGAAASSSSKKEKKKKRKRADADEAKDASAPAAPSTKRPVPETIVDTSHSLSGPSKRQKGEPKAAKLAKGDAKKLDEDAAFKDSRGTSDRRKTEEGWLVYKEDELGIGDEGGDTPLCPFDCDCCF